MRLGQLTCPPGSRRNRKRKGLGPGSGTGKTAGRGHKGQRARSGARRGLRTGFTGGSMPLYRHVPKVGFSNPFRVTYQVVNLEAIAARGLEGEIGPPELARAGLIKRASQPVKVLAQGELDRVLTIKAHAFSRAAVEKIERAGGQAEVL